MIRGELWWAFVDKRRPVVLVSRDEAYAVRALILAVPVTSTMRGFAGEVRLGRREGLDRACVANCDALGVLPKNALLERIRRLSRGKLDELDRALRFVLGLDDRDS